MHDVLKNVIDWVSRYRPQPFHARHALLLSASPSMAGGNRGLWALRVPLDHLGAHVFPDMFSLRDYSHPPELGFKVLEDYGVEGIEEAGRNALPDHRR